MPRIPVFGILDYPGAQQAAVHGLLDLFTVADRLHRDRHPEGRGLEVVRLSVEGGAPEVPGRPLAALLLPPSLGQLPEARPELVAWLRDRHAEGTLLGSVCAGAFVLAETGVLAGRPATTHWGLRDAFRTRFPDVQLDTDRLLIEDGDLLTAGGLMAWVDLGLRLIHRFLGSTTLLATARHFLVDPGGREQRFYSTFAPDLTHGDADILRVQHWLQGQGGGRTRVPELAARARLGERTFLRRFQKATGLTPTEYIQHLRVGRARELLEQTELALDEVAWRVGYVDAGAFRKVFLRLMGLTPGEYRRRFGVRD